MTKSYYKILVCPETKQKLHPADAVTVAYLNDLVLAGKLLNRRDKPVIEGFEQALVREDNKYAYPVRDGIAVLLPDESIVMV